VEAAGPGLQPLVTLDHRPELVAEPRRDGGAGVGERRLQARPERVAALAQLRFGKVAVDAIEAPPPPVLAAAELEQRRLEAVVVAHPRQRPGAGAVPSDTVRTRPAAAVGSSAEQLLAVDLGDEARDLVE